MKYWFKRVGGVVAVLIQAFAATLYWGGLTIWLIVIDKLESPIPTPKEWSPILFGLVLMAAGLPISLVLSGMMTKSIRALIIAGVLTAYATMFATIEWMRVVGLDYPLEWNGRWLIACLHLLVGVFFADYAMREQAKTAQLA